MGERRSREWERRVAGEEPAAVAVARPEPAAMLLALQHGAGNRATAGMVSRLRAGSASRPVLQRVKANVALNTLSKLIQNAPAVSLGNEAQEITNLRIEIETDKAEAGKGGGDKQISPAQLLRLNTVEAAVIANAPMGVNMQQQIADTTTAAARDAQLIVDTGGGRAANLPLAILAAKMNRKQKMDVEIHGGTTQPLVRAAALADGYTLFGHVHYTATVDPNDPNQYFVALSNPAHPSRPEFDAHMGGFLADGGFVSYDDGQQHPMAVYLDAAHTHAGLTARLAQWHPGIASDKTQPGEFREDPPHPQVANPVHSTRAHTHLQAPGCLQTTILI
jgi:hypothetical protein